LEDGGEATHEDGDAADMLNNHGRVSDETPELVRLKARISLKMI